MALLSAVATLFAALFVCLGSAEQHHADGAVSFTAAQTTRVPPAEARYGCPHHDGACGLLPSLSPAVLTMPPPAAPAPALNRPPHLVVEYTAGPAPRTGALARAPDLHALQILRT